VKAGEGMTDDLRATLTAIVDRVLPNLCSGYVDESARRKILLRMVTDAADLENAALRESIAVSSRAYDHVASQLGALEQRVIALTLKLEKYGTHTNDCQIHLCATCHHSLWLHDRANDIDEEACDTFTPDACSCGFVAALDATKAPK
jgi:hypothetical protein